MHKKISIFALDVHGNYIGENKTSGVDFVRIIQPMKYLAKQPGFEVYIWDNSKEMDWRDVCKNYDVIYTSYTPNEMSCLMMEFTARQTGTKIIYDVDDNLWDILKDNPAYPTFHPGARAMLTLQCTLQGADYVTTTNQFLKHAMAHKIPLDYDKIKVFPNYIDLDLYKSVPKFKDTNELHITHYGSTTHFSSLQESNFVNAIKRILNDYPNAVFETVGAFIPKLKEKFGQRYISSTGSPDLYTWVRDKFPSVMERTDVFVTPLTDNTYNKSKSSIKYLEISSAKKPGVYQDIRQYKEIIKHGENGMLAYTENDWYYSIKELLENKQLRQTMGENAYKSVKSDYTIQANIDKYVNFFQGMYEK